MGREGTVPRARLGGSRPARRSGSRRGPPQVSDLVAALDRLLEEHRRIGSPLERFLFPGVDPEAARATLRGLGLDPPAELVELYAWRDGGDEDAYRDSGAGVGYPRLFDNVFFGPLSRAVDTYREYLEIDRNVVATVGDPAAATWPVIWFPPFSGGTPVFAVDCTGGATRGALYQVNWHPPIEEPVRRRFRDLAHLLESVVRRFQAGGYRWDASARFLVASREVIEELRDLEIAEARGG